MYFKKKEIKNYVVVTSSTGFNACPIFNGKIFVTPEFGMIDKGINYGFDKELIIQNIKKYGVDYIPIGTFLSGISYSIYPKEYFKKNYLNPNNELIKLTKKYLEKNKLSVTKENILNNFTPKNVVRAFKINSNQSPQKDLVHGAWKSLNTILSILSCAYFPLDEIIFMGSMTKDWEILFKKPINDYVQQNKSLPLKCPIIRKNEIEEIGIRGAVYFAKNYNKLK